ncbi:hypothetical protein BH20ACT5_BH20ACT5_22970 [soil metagenome]
MRWERLFADLEAQADVLAAAELDAEVAERSRAEYGRLALTDRLRAAVGQPLRLAVLGVGDIRGELLQVGVDWLLFRETASREVLIRLAAVTSVSGLGAATAAARALGPVEYTLDLRRSLRELGRDRAPVVLQLVDGGLVGGTIDRVGADFVEVAEHPPGEPRRAGAVRSVHTVVITAIAAVRSY